uniref:SGNH hydrolase-type esterase domain-containing protein n=1 Tax=Ditylum brightwellii TaxID=49249 RepID=A0A7S2A3S8_9STRA|mmetsp:Transcript_7894/g.11757  ORF Transcript_7894/g.11757 Transcript_7894/m.11757 type:complete len:658 (+) Transcript_7894:247-2220(+)
MRYTDKQHLLLAVLPLLSITKILRDYEVTSSFDMNIGFKNNQQKAVDGTHEKKDLSLVVGKHEAELLCNKTNETVNAVRNQALLNETEALFWNQIGPLNFLTCEQLIRSLPTLRNRSNDTSGTNINGATIENMLTARDGSKFELQNLISLQRLAVKLTKLEEHSHHHLTVVVIGGSMTTGWVDLDKRNNENPYNIAFPRKLEQFMQQQWPASSVKVINIAAGGGDENTWLGRLDLVMELDPDVILVESAVNDQCDYDKQDERSAFVNQTSFSLLNLLMNFPQKPAVISVELFRTSLRNWRDANKHCRGRIQSTSDHECYYCPQWWKPQTWRENARKYNSVSHASYRDAVWPIQDHPPDNLCSKYWNGWSHPQLDVHALIASTIFFQFLVVMEKTNAFLQLSKQNEDTFVVSKAIDIPNNVCLDHISSYYARQEDPKDPFEDNIISEGDPTTHSNSSNNYEESCWSFRADVRKKYGWICEVDRNSTLLPLGGVSLHSNVTVGDGVQDHKYLHLSKKLHIGGDGKIIISRLVSYDDRMAMAQVWFTSSNNNGLDSHTNNSNSNIFQGDPVWNISSWHEDKTSIPQPYAIQLDALQLKESLQIQWPLAEGSDSSNSSNRNVDSSESSLTVEVTFNIKMLLGSSRSISRVDKFKLLGIVTC